MKYFSSKVATESTFCNRDIERQLLINYISQNEHTVIVAPRRYGKTSLAKRAMKESKLTFGQVDFFCVVYEEDVCRKIAKGVTEITGQLVTLTAKTINFLESVFKSASIGFNAGVFEIKASFAIDINPIEQVVDLLEGLEKIAAEKKKKVILFMDEFQDILKLERPTQLQAAIRTVAQHSEYVTYIFSGSSRLMLEKIFDDKNQPLFMMCQKMLLGRINKEHFKKHIQKACNANWNLYLADEIIDLILDLTQCHTYYVNTLCSDLMQLDKLPDEKSILLCWDRQMDKNRNKIVSELERLNSNRLKVIIVIALLGSVGEPNSKSFLDQVKLPLSSTQKAVKYLLDYDYLYQREENGHLALIDPLMKTFLQNQY